MIRKFIIILVLLSFAIGCRSTNPYSKVDKLLMSDDLFTLKGSYTHPDWDFYRIIKDSSSFQVCNPFKQIFTQNDSLNAHSKKVLGSYHYTHVSAEILSNLKFYKIYKYGKHGVDNLDDIQNYLAYILINKADTVIYCFNLNSIPKRIKELDRKISHNFLCETEGSFTKRN